MSRVALVVGINLYPFLKSNDKRQNLTTPASDAEKIAKILKTKGDFKVKRLPVKLSEDNHQIDADGTLKAEELQNAIGQLFNPEGENIPHTALLYFIGHGLRKVSYGVTEGFLATSDVNPNRNQWGVSLKWLRELLQKSPVKEQIIWLDCCYSGELLNFTEADLGTGNQEQTRFFIAASREYELAEANVFSRTFLEALNPSNHPKGLVDNDALIAYLKEHLKNAPQQPIFANPNRQIPLTGTKGETLFTATDGDCPYKGLRFFDVADADYFYGRERLTQQLIEKVQVGKASFLAVLGVSGSGKSSLLRAGLIYQLQHKDRLPQTQSWKISIFTPGEKPLESLAMSFLEKEWTDGQRYEELQRVKQAIDKGAKGFADYIKVSQSPRTLLIVDQFEEVFTVCESQKERSHFITTLLGALQHIGDKLCLIFAMRDDFLGKCAAYQELATLIQSNLLMVTPMNEGELRDAIVKPASKVGRRVEENLINEILKDLGVESSEEEATEAEPGLLPLLSYTLEQLWYRQTLNWLRLDSYNDLGGVRQTLENLAEKAYKALSKTEQRIADQIFIKLTQLGAGTPDTRKQIRMDALVSSRESVELVEQVVQKLADVRLIVTHDVSVPDSSPSQQKENVIVIDVAHEALIRHWGRLQKLLENNREAIRTERKIQVAAEEWQNHDKSKDYLLTGLRLGEAEEFLHNESKIVPVSGLARELIEESREESERLQKERDRQRRRTILSLMGFSTFAIVLAVVAGLGWWRAVVGERRAITKNKNIELTERSNNLEQFFVSENSLEVLIQAIRVGKELKQLQRSGKAEPATQMRILLMLQKIIYNIREYNRLTDNSDSIFYFKFSPNSQIIATYTAENNPDDNIINLWRLDGTLKTTIKGSVFRNFSPNSRMIATTKAGQIKLWDLDGNLRQNISTNYRHISGVIFSPDGNTIVSTVFNGDIFRRHDTQIWNNKGILIETLENTESPAFSHNGEIIIMKERFDLSDKNQLLQVRKLDGTLINSIDPKTSLISEFEFSPDGQMIATLGDGQVKFWKLDGTLINSFEQGYGSEIEFSPDGQIIAIGDNSGPVTSSTNLYKLDGTLITTLEGVFRELKFSPDSKYIYANNYYDNLARSELWEINGTKINTFVTNDFEFSPDGNFMAWTYEGDQVRVWRRNNISLSLIKASGSGINSIDFSPDDSMIVSASGNPVGNSDNTIKLWGIDGNLISIFEQNIAGGGGIEKVVFSPDGKIIASTSSLEPTSIQLWSLDGKLINKLEHPKFISSISFSPDSKFIASSETDKIKLWELDGTLLTTIQVSQGYLNDIDFSPNGEIIVLGYDNNTIELWKLDGTFLKTLEGHQGYLNEVSFSPDGQIIASASYDQTIKLWNLDGNLRTTIEVHTDSVSSISFHPNGNIIASASFDDTVKLWTLDGTLLGTLKDHNSGVRTVRFSHDGKTLVSGSSDGEIIIWNLDIDDLLIRGCHWIRDYLKNSLNLTEEDKNLCYGIDQK